MGGLVDCDALAGGEPAVIEQSVSDRNVGVDERGEELARGVLRVTDDVARHAAPSGVALGEVEKGQ